MDEKVIEKEVKSPQSDKFFDAVDDHSEKDEAEIMKQIDELMDQNSSEEKKLTTDNSKKGNENEENFESKISDEAAVISDDSFSEELKATVEAEAEELLRSVVEEEVESKSQSEQDSKNNADKSNENSSIVNQEQNSEVNETDDKQNTIEKDDKETEIDEHNNDDVEKIDTIVDNDTEKKIESNGEQKSPQEQKNGEQQDDPPKENTENATADDEDDLLVSCDAPEKSQEELNENNEDEDDDDNDDDESSGNDEQEEKVINNDESNENGNSGNSGQSEEKVENEEVDQKNEETDALEGVRSEENENIEKMEVDNEDDESKIRLENDEDFNSTSVQLNFLRKFATKSGEISRSELEELLLTKISECILFTSENAQLRSRIEKQEKIFESLKARIDSLSKQYNDLDMVHKRVMKDLKERPHASITPVKITRAVGLQVSLSTLITQKSSTFTSEGFPPKRKMESPTKEDTPAEQMKRKKITKITPMRAPLTDNQKRTLECRSSIEQERFKADITKSLIGTSVTLTARKSVSSNNGPTTQSIDLTDEDESPVNRATLPPGIKFLANNPNTQIYHPPALVAINPLTQKAMIVKQAYPTQARGHPAPLPPTPKQFNRPAWKKIPPRPTIRINKASSSNGIIVSWVIEGFNAKDYAEITNYEIYAYEETSAPAMTSNWRKVGDVKALALPMAVTLTQFMEGQKYYFAVRAIDVYKRLGNFSVPKTWE